MSTRGTPSSDDEPGTRAYPERGGTSGGVGPGGRGRPGGGAGGAPDRSGRNTVGWIALLVAALLTAWQVVVGLTMDGVAEASQDVYASVSLFVTLILAVGAVVLGLVAMGQRRGARWPALVGLAVGAQAFLVTVASWLGDLMNNQL